MKKFKAVTMDVKNMSKVKGGALDVTTKYEKVNTNKTVECKKDVKVEVTIDVEVES